jgi:hypothetical protein
MPVMTECTPARVRLNTPSRNEHRLHVPELNDRGPEELGLAIDPLGPHKRPVLRRHVGKKPLVAAPLERFTGDGLRLEVWKHGEGPVELERVQ